MRTHLELLVQKGAPHCLSSVNNKLINNYKNIWEYFIADTFLFPIIEVLQLVYEGHTYNG